MGIFIIAGFIVLTFIPPIFLIGVGWQWLDWLGIVSGIVTWLAIGLGLNVLLTARQDGSPKELFWSPSGWSRLKKLLWLIPEAWVGWISPISRLTDRLMRVDRMTRRVRWPLGK